VVAKVEWHPGFGKKEERTPTLARAEEEGKPHLFTPGGGGLKGKKGRARSEKKERKKRVAYNLGHFCGRLRCKERENSLRRKKGERGGKKGGGNCLYFTFQEGKGKLRNLVSIARLQEKKQTSGGRRRYFIVLKGKKRFPYPKKKDGSGGGGGQNFIAVEKGTPILLMSVYNEEGGRVGVRKGPFLSLTIEGGRGIPNL